MENERGAEKWHIASVSWGKDSLAMLLLLIEKGWPLDEVVFYGETESHRQVCRGAGCGGLYWNCRRRNAALGKKEKAIQAASVGGVGRDGSRRPCPLL